MSSNINLDNLSTSLPNPLNSPSDLPTPGIPQDAISLIQESEDIPSLLTLLASLPILMIPKDSGEFDRLIQLANISGKSGNEVDTFLRTLQIKNQETVSKVLEAWGENLRNIEEERKRREASPIYQQQEMIRHHGDPLTGHVSGVLSPQAAEIGRKNPRTVVTGPASVESSEPTQEERKEPSSLVIPMMTVAFIGGALTLGVSQIPSDLATSGIHVNGLEIVEKLQSALPVQMTDFLPTINLFAPPLFYLTAWSEAIGSLKKGGLNGDSRKAIEEFAKQVIVLVSNPQSTIGKLLPAINSTDPSALQNAKEKITVLKLGLCAVALSLLYSLEVGKVAGSKFLGIEPQEFRDLLNGTLSIEEKGTKELTENQRLTLTLIALARSQIEELPLGLRETTIGALLSYLSLNRDVKQMTEPSKVFQEILKTASFDQGAEGFESTPV